MSSKTALYSSSPKRCCVRLLTIHNVAISGGTLIDRKGCRELFVSAYLDLVEKVAREVLTVVANQVVSWPCLTHVVYSHLTCN